MNFSWDQQRRVAAIEHLEQSAWLRHVEWLSEIDSTNSLARRQLAGGFDRWPGLFVADRQTAGRGRGANAWWSPPGCLMFSLVLGQEQLPLDATHWPQLSLVIGVAAAQAVEAELPGIEVQLKWPNDVLIQHRKLAGILVESVRRSTDGGMAFVVGIGLNVAVDWSQADEVVRARACSLANWAEREPSVESVLIRLIEHMELAVNDWRTIDAAGPISSVEALQSNVGAWWQAWSQRSVLTGRTVELRLPNAQRLVGTCSGINSRGHLLLSDHGQLLTVQSAEVIGWH